MMKLKWFIPFSCLATFHTPDGGLISVDTRHIVAVRPADAVKHHLAPGTNTIIYVTGQNFGVKETAEQVEDIIENCQEAN